MPTTTEDFDALRKALENNSIEDLKKILQNFDLTATDKYGRNCLMLCGHFSKSPEVVKVVLEKIEETGGPDLFKSLVAATQINGWNCLMLCYTFSKSPEVVKVLLAKIEETGGPDLLKTLLTATDKDGRTCPMLCCECSSSPEVVKLILKKIDETGGPDLLKSLLAATDKDGWNCLMLCGYYSKYPELMKLFATVLFHVDLFNIQYPKLADNHKKSLKEKAGINSSSWVPDAAGLAEVKAILQRADATAAKKKVEEEAAAKKKADEETALAKKKAADEAAAKKKAEAEAAAKQKDEEEAAAKKAEEQAAAKKKAEQEAAAKTKPDDRPTDGSVSTDAPPPSLCFRRGVPAKNFNNATNSLLSIKEAPENRPDLDDWIPDKHDRDALLLYLDRALPELKSRPAVQKLIAECSLTDDDIKILHSYKIESPYPVFKWLNGWLGGDRRDEFVKEHVAPFFTLLYRAMEKLPRVPASANRGVKVNGIPALKHTYDNHKFVCATDNTLAFWGFCSFSTEDGVVNREEFVGKPDEEGIVYSCGKLEGVNMEPFKPKGLKDEAEVLPLCPCVFRVVNCFKAGKKLIIGVEQLNHSEFSYVLPSSSK